ncbi:MAG TPA: hypothetical protein VGC67_03155 [Cellulomonas sp.]
MDCLALTGSNPVPLAVIAVVMIAVAVVLLVAVRRARRGSRRRTGIALTLMAALTVTTAGGLSLLGGTSAQAATTSDCVATSRPTTTSGATDVTEVMPAEEVVPTDPAPEADESADTEVPAADPTPTPDPTPDPDETPTPEDTPEDPEGTPEETPDEDPAPEEDPEVAPEAAVYGVDFPEQWVYSPPYDVENFTQQHTVVVSQISGDVATDPVVLLVPDQADGYWTASALLEADGSTAADVTITRVDGATRFEIGSPPTPEAERTFLVVLRYDTSTWDTSRHMNEDDSSYVLLRPTSTLTARIESSGATSSLEIPGYLEITPAP